jgi:hypothetical protein
VAAFSLSLATVPGELAESRDPVRAAIRRLLFDGEPDPVTQRPTSIFPRNLVLPDEEFLTEAQQKAWADAPQAERDHLPRTLVLRGRDLRFAVLDRADLRKADLTGARLTEASLNAAKLQHTWLSGAQLQGASLREARLQGVSLLEAQLQGADLGGAWLQGADLRKAEAWRVRAAESHTDDMLSTDLRFDPTSPCPGLGLPEVPCPRPRSWAEWLEVWVAEIPGGGAHARRRLDVLLAANDPSDATATRTAWAQREQPAQQMMARYLGDIACDDTAAPHVSRGILQQIASPIALTPFYGGRGLGPYRSVLANRIASNDCPGARGLTDDDRRRLAAIAARTDGDLGGAEGSGSGSR